VPRSVSSIAACIIMAVALLIIGRPAVGETNATAWVEGHNSRARLLFGGRPGPDGEIERFAGIEIVLPPGWKTYWRQPGSAGGIPPALDWSGSANLTNAVLYFPPPSRFVDSTGHTIGYKKSVVLPVRLKVTDPTRPVDFDLKIFFGVCREICIPAEASFRTTIHPRQFMHWPPALSQAVDSLPVSIVNSSQDPLVPTVQRIIPVARSDGDRALLVDVRFPGGTSGADLFAERGDGMGLAMTEAVARPATDVIRFRLPVTSAAEWAKLGETGIVLTIVSDRGASTVRRPRP
jgi:DsbC/DsbD-like thiol-disulfide interchange protein